jgi:hypothetical protein
VTVEELRKELANFDGKAQVKVESSGEAPLSLDITQVLGDNECVFILVAFEERS